MEKCCPGGWYRGWTSGGWHMNFHSGCASANSLYPWVYELLPNVYPWSWPLPSPLPPSCLCALDAPPCLHGPLSYCWTIKQPMSLARMVLSSFISLLNPIHPSSLASESIHPNCWIQVPEGRIMLVFSSQNISEHEFLLFNMFCFKATKIKRAPLDHSLQIQCCKLGLPRWLLARVSPQET